MSQSAYLVGLLIAHSSGAVEKLDATELTSIKECEEYIGMVEWLKGDAPPGTDYQLRCMTRHRLELAIDEHHCRFTRQETNKERVSYYYECEPTWASRVIRWITSLWQR